MDVFENEKKDAIHFLQVLSRHWRSIALCTVASVAVAVVITLLMPPRYMSYGVLFPTSGHQGYSPSGRPQPGFDVDVDRLLQVIDSRTLRDSLVNLLDLTTHYKIDTSQRTWRDEVDKRLRDDLEFQQSKYLSVVILAKMTDPELAANTVNAIIDLSGPLWQNVTERFDQDGLREAQRLYREKGLHLESLSDSITRVQRKVTNEQLEIVLANWKSVEGELEGVHKEMKALRDQYGFYNLEEDWLLLQEAISELQLTAQINDETTTASANDELGMLASRREEALKERLAELRQKEKGLQAAFASFPPLESRMVVLEGLAEESRSRYMSQLSQKASGNQEIQLKYLLDLYQSELHTYNSLKNNFEELRFRFQKPTPPLYVVDRAVPSYKKFEPSLIKNAMMGALLGLAAALLWVYARTRTRKTESA